jgi:hypothetical protein
MNMSEMYEQIYSWENLRRAYQKAAKGKRGKTPVAEFEYKLADNLLILQEELTAQTYRPGAWVERFCAGPLPLLSI